MGGARRRVERRGAEMGDATRTAADRSALQIEERRAEQSRGRGEARTQEQKTERRRGVEGSR